jgi:transcriptional regulator with XRE-family HTH domain
VADAKTIFGARLKAIRQERRLTQEQLAKAVGVDYKHLGAIERGQKAPSFELIGRLAAVLKIEMYKLFLKPEDESTDFESDLEAVLLEVTKARRARIQKFITDVLRVMKKLER